MNKLRPVCAKCLVEMEPERNGVIVWHPYEKPELGPITEQHGNLTVINVDRMLPKELFWDKDRVDFLVNGDLYICPKCNCQIITGFGTPQYDNGDQQPMKHWVKCAEERGEAYRITRT